MDENEDVYECLPCRGLGVVASKRCKICNGNGWHKKPDSKCKHKNTLDSIHSKVKIDRDYWLFTELFCLLHDGKDFCNCI